jgi:hypothetical protein
MFSCNVGILKTGIFFYSKNIYCLPVKEKVVSTGMLRGQGSSVGIATGYGMDGPGIKSRWGRDFSHTSRLALGPTQWVPGLSLG